MLKKLNTSLFRIVAVACLALIFWSSGLSAKSTPDIPAKDRVVVIVSIDGLASFYLNDPKSEVPTLRRLASEGAVADRMIASLPTMTWPNHTTLVSGVTPARHGVIGNDYWDREQGKKYKLITDPIFNKDEIVKVPTLDDVAHDAGLKTAAICWPATRGAKSFDWTVPDVFSQELFQKYSTASLLEEFRAAGIPFEQQEKWCKSDGGHERDLMYTKMLLHILRKHQPNLTLLHLMEVDHAQHHTGPRSAEAYTAVKFEDERIKEIVDVLEKEFAGRATLLVVSDHGFIAVRHRIQPNVKLRQAGLLKVSDGKMTERKVFATDQGGSSFIYVQDREHRAELIDKVVAMFKDAEGIDQIVPSSDFKKWGLPSPDKDPRMADVVLTAKDGYTFSEKADGNEFVTGPFEQQFGAHGHSPLRPDMYATFIAWGNEIKRGAKLGEINNLDVAPTAGALLHLKMKNTEGHVLKTIFSK